MTKIRLDILATLHNCYPSSLRVPNLFVPQSSTTFSNTLVWFFPGYKKTQKTHVVWVTGVPLVPASLVPSARCLAGSDLRRRKRRNESRSDFCNDLRRDRVTRSPVPPDTVQYKNILSTSLLTGCHQRSCRVSIKTVILKVFFHNLIL